MKNYFEKKVFIVSNDKYQSALKNVVDISDEIFFSYSGMGYIVDVHIEPMRYCYEDKKGTARASHYFWINIIHPLLKSIKDQNLSHWFIDEKGMMVDVCYLSTLHFADTGFPLIREFEEISCKTIRSENAFKKEIKSWLLEDSIVPNIQSLKEQTEAANSMNESAKIGRKELEKNKWYSTVWGEVFYRKGLTVTRGQFLELMIDPNISKKYIEALDDLRKANKIFYSMEIK